MSTNDYFNLHHNSKVGSEWCSPFMGKEVLRIVKMPFRGHTAGTQIELRALFGSLGSYIPVEILVIHVSLLAHTSRSVIDG